MSIIKHETIKGFKCENSKNKVRKLLKQFNAHMTPNGFIVEVESKEEKQHIENILNEYKDTHNYNIIIEVI